MNEEYLMDQRQLQQEQNRKEKLSASLPIQPAYTPLPPVVQSTHNSTVPASTMSDQRNFEGFPYDLDCIPMFQDENCNISMNNDDGDILFPIDDPATVASSSYMAKNTNTVSKSKKTSSLGQVNFDMGSLYEASSTLPPKVPVLKKVKETTLPRRSTRSSPAPAKSTSSKRPANPYAGHDYEFLNTALHKTYDHFANTGHFPLENFDFNEARKDVAYLKALIPGDIEDDEDLEMVAMWIGKVVATLKKEFDENDEANEDSDSEVEEE
jgi:hypothetical protein